MPASGDQLGSCKAMYICCLQWNSCLQVRPPTAAAVRKGQVPQILSMLPLCGRERSVKHAGCDFSKACKHLQNHQKYRRQIDPSDLTENLFTIMQYSQVQCNKVDRFSDSWRATCECILHETCACMAARQLCQLRQSVPGKLCTLCP